MLTFRRIADCRRSRGPDPQPRPEWHVRFSQIRWLKYWGSGTRPWAPPSLRLLWFRAWDLVKNAQYILDTKKFLANTVPIFETVSVVFSTRRPASADRTARRQFQATGQPVSRTQASDAMTSRLLRYEAKCVQRRCFQWGSVRLRSDIKGTELSPANILIPLECATTLSLTFLYNETLQQTFRPLLSKLYEIRQI